MKIFPEFQTIVFIGIFILALYLLLHLVFYVQILRQRQETGKRVREWLLPRISKGRSNAENEDKPLEEIKLLRLDAAAPERASVGRAFDMVVALRQLESPPLSESEVDEVKSGEIDLRLPSDEKPVLVWLSVTSPDCYVEQPNRTLLLYHQQDGPLVYFQLTPRYEGRTSILITIYQGSILLGNTRIFIFVEKEADRIFMEITSYPLRLSRADRFQLMTNLRRAFSREELDKVCFLLGFDLDNFTLQKDKYIIELIEICLREGKLSDLVELCQALRPHLSWRLETLPDLPLPEPSVV